MRNLFPLKGSAENLKRCIADRTVARGWGRARAVRPLAVRLMLGEEKYAVQNGEPLSGVSESAFSVSWLSAFGVLCQQL